MQVPIHEKFSCIGTCIIWISCFKLVDLPEADDTGLL